MALLRRGQRCLLASSSVSLVLLLLVLYGSMSSPHPAGGGLDRYQLTGPPLYKLDLGWPRNPELFGGPVFAVAVDPHASVVYVAQRGVNVPKVLVFSTDGRFLTSWNSSDLETPHGMFLAGSGSQNPSVWVTDVGTGPLGHTVKEFSPTGTLLQVLGTPGRPGSGLDPLQFDQPSEVFVDPSGDMYVVDGDGGLNNRLLKLDRDRRVVWVHGGRAGAGPAQFYIPHSVTVDGFRRVWVADRGNRRIQVFSAGTGDWLGSWGSCFGGDDGPYSVRVSPDRRVLVVVRLHSGQVSLLAAPPPGNIGQCTVVSVVQLGDQVQPHLVDLDPGTGDLYVAQIGAQQAQKFTPFTLGGLGGLGGGLR
ncbi:NHL repeat-containing protein 3-like [Cololabis saira]|uniref:NHL repeat-containing protein 3-like n=1 Tax=Cololabis saira TaxID=129043 RepID=UPI002AD2AA29|nr:NHL repeat-containing protein 3-like [Cololabis saira]